MLGNYETEVSHILSEGRERGEKEKKAKWTHQKVLKLPQLTEMNGESWVEFLALEYDRKY